MESAAVARVAYRDYLALEASSSVRHEYVDGEVVAMAGGTPEHGALAAAMMGELRAALQGKPCRVFSSDTRVRIPETNLSTYPDATVVCQAMQTDNDDPDAIINPVVLIEVLSDSTEAYDRGAKSAHYRRIASLREYVLVGQREPHIEVYRRTPQDRWELLEARAGQTIELMSLGVTLSVDGVYTNPLTAASS